MKLGCKGFRISTLADFWALEGDQGTQINGDRLQQEHLRGQL